MKKAGSLLLSILLLLSLCACSSSRGTKWSKNRVFDMLRSGERISEDDNGVSGFMLAVDDTAASFYGTSYASAYVDGIYVQVFDYYTGYDGFTDELADHIRETTCRISKELYSKNGLANMAIATDIKSDKIIFACKNGEENTSVFR